MRSTTWTSPTVRAHIHAHMDRQIRHPDQPAQRGLFSWRSVETIRTAWPKQGHHPPSLPWLERAGLTALHRLGRQQVAGLPLLAHRVHHSHPVTSQAAFLKTNPGHRERRPCVAMVRPEYGDTLCQRVIQPLPGALPQALLSVVTLFNRREEACIESFTDLTAPGFFWSMW